ncbi:MAG: acyltransferase domain-containing protein, partial [Cyanobacteria bacterium J06631_9]
SEVGRPWQLIPLSAKTPTALAAAAQNLVDHLEQQSDLSIADLAFTLQVGRRAMPYRRYCLCQSIKDAIAQLKQPVSPAQPIQNSTKSVVLMFPGQGTQHIDMAKGLYKSEPRFAQVLNECAELLAYHSIDLIGLLYPSGAANKNNSSHTGDASRLTQTAYVQPALFAVEYALAQLWLSWGIQPQALIGHSVGEYVAACIAGIFSLKDALTLMVKRGQLMQRCKPGSMLSVLSSADQVQALLPDALELATLNGPQNCVVSGPTEAIHQFQQQLEAQDIPCRLLTTSHAFHSAMMEPAVADFLSVLQSVSLSPPEIDLLSNVTGTWLADHEATDPKYWARQLREPVRFSQGIIEALKLESPVLIEVGPGHTLTKLTQQHLASTNTSEALVLQSLPHPRENKADTTALMSAVGELWLTGINIHWTKLYKGQTRHRLSLPTYPFERESYWVPLQAADEPSTDQSRELSKKENISDWFYLPSWKRLPLTVKTEEKQRHDHWLIFADANLQQQLQEHISNLAISPEVTWVHPGDAPAQTDVLPTQIIYGWEIKSESDEETNGLQSLVSIINAYAPAETPINFIVLSQQAQAVIGTESLNSVSAQLWGLCQTIAQETSGHTSRLIDLSNDSTGNLSSLEIQQLVQECLQPYDSQQRQIAYRHGQRWVRTYEALSLPGVPSVSGLKPGGTYLIAGDLVEGLGMVYAQALVKQLGARLILIGRPGLPAATEWEKWLLTHGPQHSISQLIRKLQALGESDKQYLWFSGDLTDAPWVSDCIDQGIAQFGEITGVFHAGVMGDRASCPLNELTLEENNRISHTKVIGIQSIQKALANHTVDFYLLQSSLSTIVGGSGFAAYAAANSYLDVLAHQQNSETTQWLSLNWDACQLDDTVAEQTSSNLMALALTPGEIWETTQRVLAQPQLCQAIVSPRDLQSRLSEAFAPQEKVPKPVEDGAATNQLKAHSRPALTTDYIAPRTPVEQKVAQAMGELLGIDAVGVEDNFFELGGHSLLAIQAVTRLRQEYQVDLPLRAFLFEAPTVVGIAKIIEEQIGEIPADTQATLESLLDDVEAMLPEEVKSEV